MSIKYDGHDFDAWQDGKPINTDMNLTGKVIARAVCGLDGHGYGFVGLSFTDGTAITIKEISQSGQIEVAPVIPLQSPRS